MINPLNLLALTFFADPTFNDKVKQGAVSSLPVLPTIPGISSSPSLPAQFIAKGLTDPGTWPSLPAIDLPASIFTWVGSNHQYPQTPAKDPFYKPDLSTYSNLKNGDIISVRPIGLSAMFPAVASAWQISYRTEGALGNPAADVATVLIPRNYDGKSLISFQVWEDSNNIKCSTSYAFMQNLHDPTIDMLLLQGWAILAPDYEGINSAFAVGFKNGKSVLDAIRATTKAQSQIKLSFSEVGVYGYSGGSVATGFAIEMQPTYAPDVKIKAACIGGVVADLKATLDTINNGVFVGFAFAGLYGLAAEYGLIELLQALLKPQAANRANQVLNQCSTWDVLNYVGENIFDYFIAGSSVLNTPFLATVLNKLHMGQSVPQVPLFVHQGASDEIAPVDKVDNLVDYYCQQGVKVDYQRDDGLGHILEMPAGVPSVVNYFKKALVGSYVPKSCSSHQDAINNNGVSVPNTNNQQMLKQAALGDFSAFGLPNVAGL